MKKRTLIALVTVLFCTAFTTFNEPSKDILGTWKIDNSSLESVTKSIINATRKTNPEGAQQQEDNFSGMMEMIGGIEITYKADNTYEVVIPQQGIQSGKYELVDNSHSLLVTPQDRPGRKDSILEISPTRLRIINRERGDTTLYVHP